MERIARWSGRTTHGDLLAVISQVDPLRKLFTGRLVRDMMTHVDEQSPLGMKLSGDLDGTGELEMSRVRAMSQSAEYEQSWVREHVRRCLGQCRQVGGIGEVIDTIGG